MFKKTAVYHVVWLSALLLFSFAGFVHTLKPKTVLYSKCSDIIMQHYGNIAGVYSFVKKGECFPLWRSDQFSGYPAFTNPQLFLTSPFSIVYYLFSPGTSINLTVWFLFVLAGVIWYVSAWMFRMNRYACFFVSISGMFNFKLICAVYAGLITHLPILILFPFIFSIVYRYMKTPSIRNAFVGMGICVLCLHAGYSQYVYYGFIFLMFYMIWEFLAGNRRLLRRNIYSAGCLLCLCILAAGLTAYKYLPLIMEIPVLSRNSLPYKQFLFGYSFSWRHILTFFRPEILGTPLTNMYPPYDLWEEVAYFGVVPLVFAVCAVCFGWRDKYWKSFIRFLAISFILSIILCIDSPLLSAVHQFVPGFNMFRIPMRLLYFTSFIGIILAGIGVDIVRSRFPKRQQMMHIILTMLIGLMACEGVYYTRRYVHTISVDRIRSMPLLSTFVSGDDSHNRIAVIGRWPLNYSMAGPGNIQLINGYDPYNLKHYFQYLDIVNHNSVKKTGLRVWADIFNIARWDLIDMLNVKFIISSSKLTIPAKRLMLKNTIKDQNVFINGIGFKPIDIFVYENLSLLPRIYFADKLVKTGSFHEVTDLIINTTVGRSAIIVDSNKGIQYFDGRQDASDEIVQWTSGHVKVKTNTKSGGFAIISEIWHPGWNIYIDKKPVAIKKTNIALMGIHIPAGEHTIQCIFQPVGWKHGICVSIIGFFIVIGMILYNQKVSLLYAKYINKK